MAAKGKTYPWQKLERLEGYIESNIDDFKSTFLDTGTQYVQHIGFMSYGLIIEVGDYASGDVIIKFVDGKLFKRWLQGY